MRPDMYSQVRQTAFQANHSNDDLTLRKCLLQFLEAAIYSPAEECNCPLSCHEIQFNQLFLKTKEEKMNVWQLAFQYRSRKTTIMGEFPLYTPLGLLSDVGGLVGLLVGMSLLSVIELTVYLVIWMADKMCARSKFV